MLQALDARVAALQEAAETEVKKGDTVTVVVDEALADQARRTLQVASAVRVVLGRFAERGQQWETRRSVCTTWRRCVCMGCIAGRRCRIEH